METVSIQGLRYSLRDWELGDVDLYAHWLQPHHDWHQLDGPYYAKLSAEKIPEFAAKLRTRIETQNFSTPRTRLVIADRANNALVGTVSWYWESKETNWLSVGIVIYDPAHWRKGIGYEALGLWSDYLFATMPDIMRLDLRTWSGNTGMMKLAEKLGYQEEARFRMARVVDGEFYDGMGYGVLKSEWLAAYPNGFAQHLLD